MMNINFLIAKKWFAVEMKTAFDIFFFLCKHIKKTTHYGTHKDEQYVKRFNVGTVLLALTNN